MCQISEHSPHFFGTFGCCDFPRHRSAPPKGDVVCRCRHTGDGEKSDAGALRQERRTRRCIDEDSPDAPSKTTSALGRSWRLSESRWPSMKDPGSGDLSRRLGVTSEGCRPVLLTPSESSGRRRAETVGGWWRRAVFVRVDRPQSGRNQNSGSVTPCPLMNDMV